MAVKEAFGTTPDGREISRFILANGTGMRVAILTYGGIIQEILVPDRRGTPANVVLGFATLDDYLSRNPYFGCITGRYANRIGRGAFMLDGRQYSVACNDGPHALHGGLKGFDKQVWEAEEVSGEHGAGLRLSRTSPDGEEGYPGTLAVSVTYSLTERQELVVEYQATTDSPTVINLTNHSYFNLAGEGSGDIQGHRLLLNASRYTPVDAGLMPTGEIAPVAGTPLDFTTAQPIGARIREGHEQLVRGRGYDHNVVLDRSGSNPDPAALVLAAQIDEPVSGRRLTVRTTEPGVQFYTGNFLDGTLVGSGGRMYRQGDGFCLETQHFPDSPNQPHFPSTVLRPGQVHRSTTVFAFSTDAG